MYAQITQQENNGILRDSDKNGKDRKWKERKRQSIKLSEMFEVCFYDTLMTDGYSREDIAGMLTEYRDWIDNTYLKKRDATSRCGDILEFVRTEEGKLKLYQAWFCKDRLCPMCNWRRAMKFSVQIAQILGEINRQGIKGRPLFLTLTMRNVPGEEIGQSFSEFAVSFNRLMKYKAVKNYCIGAIRTSEITYNKNRDDYNTHIHCLLWMSTSYFSVPGAYMAQEKWTELWKKAARLDYTPVVNVKAIKPKTPTETDPTGLFAAVLEVSKYPIKPDAFKDLVDESEVWGETIECKRARARRIEELEKGMKYKRLISFFGIFKRIRAELKQDDIEDGDLINAEGDTETGDVVTVERYMYDRIKRDYIYSGSDDIKNEHNKDWHTK